MMIFFQKTRIQEGLLQVLLLLGPFLCPEALTSPSSISQKGSFDSNRIFVAGLSNQCSSELLQESFSQFGNIQDVSIIGREDVHGNENSSGRGRRSRKPYAFVTFDSSQSARDAILEFQASIRERDGGNSCVGKSRSLLYSEVKRANPIDTSKRKRSNSSREKEENDRMAMMKMCEKTNLILQVQSSHLDRLKDHIDQFECSGLRSPVPMLFQVEGSSEAVTKNMSLLFVSASRPTELARILGRDDVLARALKKAYVVSEGAIEGNLTDADGCEKAIHDVLGKISMNNTAGAMDNRSFRMHTFPPSCQSQILNAMEKNAAADAIRLDPRYFTDILSIVQVYTFKGRGQENMKSRGLIMSGVSPSFVTNDANSNINNDVDSAVSRAYYKLKEAIDRYANDHKTFNREMFQGAVAIDCGAAPGGWTKYLAHDLNCGRVYSVDPGELDIQHDAITHMQMKIQDAIPQLAAKGLKVDVFVSDMCLHTMETQLDYLSEAKDHGILEQNALFVLTLKCKIGYSKDNFDQQVSYALDILSQRADVSHTAVYHLFSNRKGERTVMGFLA